MQGNYNVPKLLYQFKKNAWSLSQGSGLRNEAILSCGHVLMHTVLKNGLLYSHKSVKNDGINIMLTRLSASWAEQKWMHSVNTFM